MGSRADPASEPEYRQNPATTAARAVLTATQPPVVSNAHERRQKAASGRCAQVRTDRAQGIAGERRGAASTHLYYAALSIPPTVRTKPASAEDCCRGGYPPLPENRVRKFATLTISMPRKPTSRSRSSSPVTMVCEPALT